MKKQPTNYCFDSFRFCPQDQVLVNEGRNESWELNPKESAVLEILVQNPGHLVAKDEIMKKVWSDTFVDETNIAKNVHLLRKKLGGELEDWIKTYPRKGYKFVHEVAIEGEGEEEEVEPKPKPTIEVERRLDMDINALPEAQRAGVFSDIAKRAELTGPEQSQWMNLIEGSYDFFDGALDYYKKEAPIEGLRMAVDLAPYWERRGRWIEGRERLKAALAEAKEETTKERARGLAWVGCFSYFLDDYSGARDLLTEGEKVGREVEDKIAVALSLYGLGCIKAEADKAYGEAEKMLRQGSITAAAGKADWITAWIYRAWGVVLRTQGDYPGAERMLKKSLDIREEIGDIRGIADSYSRLSVVAVIRNDTAKARVLLDKSLKTTYGVPGKQLLALTAFNLGLIEEAAEQPKAALAQFRECSRLRQEIGEKRGTARALEASGKMLVLLGREKEAARALGGAEGLRDVAGSPWSPTEERRYRKLSEEVRRKWKEEFEAARRRVKEEIVVA